LEIAAGVFKCATRPWIRRFGLGISLCVAIFIRDERLPEIARTALFRGNLKFEVQYYLVGYTHGKHFFLF
jgi:hypothetical protein